MLRFRCLQYRKRLLALGGVFVLIGLLSNSDRGLSSSDDLLREIEENGVTEKVVSYYEDKINQDCLGFKEKGNTTRYRNCVSQSFYEFFGLEITYGYDARDKNLEKRINDFKKENSPFY